MKDVFANILECVGRTPIIELNQIGADQKHRFFVKLECVNPGSSIKDRIALQMVKDAEEDGRLKPGGTIIECTSGNTGMGLAMVAAVKGYECVFVMPDKVSDEKIKALRAFGARVITTPTAVEPDDPRSYYSVAKRLANEIPNSFYSDQYHNPSNPKAHYLMTGPEIWEQMGNELDYVVATIGTGGTASGISKFLKERKPEIKMIGIDPVGSIYYEYFKTGKIPKLLTTYKVEGFGEDFMPDTIDFAYIDDVVQVSDKECFQYTREMTKKEGMFVGGSCGGAVAGALKFAKTVVNPSNFLILLPDSGSRYLSKVYDDDWMRENGFLEDRPSGIVRDVLGKRYRKIMTIEGESSVEAVVRKMKEEGISQLPVFEGSVFIGLITEKNLLERLLLGQVKMDASIREFVDREVSALEPEASIRKLYDVFKDRQVCIVKEQDQVVGIITKIDLLDYLANEGHV